MRVVVQCTRGLAPLGAAMPTRAHVLYDFKKKKKKKKEEKKEGGQYFVLSFLSSKGQYVQTPA